MVYEFFEEIKDIVKSFLVRIYNKYKGVIFLVLYFILVLGIFKIFDIENPINLEELINIEEVKININQLCYCKDQELYFLNISLHNWFEWISLTILPYTMGWAIFQFQKNRKIKKQEKAVEIAKEFSETLVNDLGTIGNVYSNSKLLKFIPTKEEEMKQFKYFNVEEARRITKRDGCIDRYLDAKGVLIEHLDNLYHVNLYLNSLECSYSDYIELLDKAKNNSLEDDELRKIKRVVEKMQGVPYHFLDLQSNTLNKLEYICMNISSKAADSKYIYPSLHQIFLRTIRTLYLEIACVNTSSKDKFYINIINVYNEWKDIYMRESRLEERRIKKANEKINPKTKTV